VIKEGTSRILIVKAISSVSVREFWDFIYVKMFSGKVDVE